MVEPDPIDVHIGRVLRRSRLALDQSMQALGSRVGVSYQQIQKYENATNRINASTLYWIATKLQMDVDAFFPDGDKGDPMAKVAAEDLRACLALDRVEDEHVRATLQTLIRALADAKG